MLESVIVLLIYLCVLAIVFYIILWVLGEIGIVIPPQILKLLWVILVLVAILMIARALLPHAGSLSLGGR